MKVLYILLTILKILGITLGGVIALLLIIAALVLFVPIRYRGNASFCNKPDVSARITYLLHMISVRFEMHEGKSELVIKLFGIKLGKKKKRKGKKKKKKNNKNKAVSLNEGTLPVMDDDAPEDLPVKLPSKKQKAYVTEDSDDFFEEKSPNEKKSIFKRIKDKYNKISSKVRNISDEINDKTNRAAFAILKDGLAKIIRHVRPSKYVIEILFGLGDPALTGEVLGAAYSFAFLSGLDVNITPDFENKIFEANSSFKGRIRLFTLAIICLKVYRNKEFKKALHKFV